MTSNDLIRRHVRAALGLFAGALALPAGAQEAPATTEAQEQVEEVVVTGFRASLNAALEDKRASAAAIDSIRAEDIAKFPDSNLAESVQRIPGVSIARDAGEGRNLSVRGLGPQFTRVRINGMEAQSTTGGTDSSGGSNRNRQFDFNVFASELFNSITARKTSSAEVEEGSLGATVDLRTARPFDYKTFTMVGALKGAYNDLAEDVDPRASFLISNTFDDERFGFLFSAAYSARKALEEGSSTVRWDQGSSVGGFLPTSTPTGITIAQANATTTFHPRIPRYGRLAHDQEAGPILASREPDVVPVGRAVDPDDGGDRHAHWGSASRAAISRETPCRCANAGTRRLAGRPRPAGWSATSRGADSRSARYCSRP